MSSKVIQKVFCGHEIKEIDTKNFTAKVVMSDETLDRYDEIIETEAWTKTIKPFMKHAVLLSSHRYSGDLRSQIGEWTKVFQEDGKLIGIPKYYVGEGNPEADWAWKLVEKGIAAFSVGLIPHKVETMDWEKWNKLKEDGKRVARRRYKEVELIETSQVLIPANPSALQRSIDGDDEIMKDVATFYFTHLDQIKDLGNVIIEESDVAEKFLIKDTTVKEVEDEKEEIVKTPDPTDVVTQLSSEIVALRVEVEKLVKLFPSINELVSVSVDPASILDIKEVIESSMKSWFDKLDDKLNVKTIVPNDSYIDDILNEKGIEESASKSTTEEQIALRTLMSLLQSTTNVIKTSVKE